MARTTNEKAIYIRSCVLGYIASKVGEGIQSTCGLSHREMGRALGLTTHSVRYTCRLLLNEGLMTASACYDEYGGQRANIYAITQKGWQQVNQERGEGSQVIEK